MKWYQYTQNNSGGHMVVDERVSDYVLIQARNGAHADERAEEIGIYFNGVDDGMDCECCGDRWYPQSGCQSGDESPMVYGREPDDESATRIYPIGCDKPVSIADALKKSWVIEPS
jgi:hypothetical protein